MKVSPLDLVKINSEKLALNWVKLTKLAYGFEWAQAQKYFKYRKILS